MVAGTVTRGGNNMPQCKARVRGTSKVWGTWQCSIAALDGQEFCWRHNKQTPAPLQSSNTNAWEDWQQAINTTQVKRTRKR